MSSGQRLIKYLAIGFAIFLSITIISGIASAVFAIFNIIPNARIHGVSWSNQRIDGTYRFENVESLSINNTTGDFRIVTGEEFKVEASRVSKGFRAEVTSDGTLKITDKNGSNFPFFFFGSPNSKVTVYLPTDFVAKEADISAGAGNLTIDGLHADDLQISAGAGNLKGRDISAESADVEGGVGNITLDRVNFSNSVIECGVGNLSIDGSLLDKTDISCGVGEVDLNLNGKPSDYGFDIETGIGNVRLNGEKISRDYITNEEAPNVITVEGGVGNVNIRIDE